MAQTQTGKLRKLGIRTNPAAEQTSSTASKTLRCQWCMVDLEPGVNVCPTCGSPGIDTAMVVPGSERAKDPNQLDVVAQSEGELDEWWNDPEEEIYRNSSADEPDRTAVIVGLLGTAVICVILGVIAAPILLADLFESSLGVTVDNPNDLRPLGGILGLLTGAFIGAIGMWVTAPRR